MKKPPMERCCGNCAHSMESETPDLVYCIAHPPVPVSHNGQVVTHFPILRLFAKCDEYRAGKTQSMGLPL